MREFPHDQESGMPEAGQRHIDAILGLDERSGEGRRHSVSGAQTSSDGFSEFLHIFPSGQSEKN
jgi:hypothetical protein